MEKIKTPTYSGYFFALLIAFIPLVQVKSIADPTLLSRQIYLLVVLLFALCLLFMNRNHPSNGMPKYLTGFSLLWLISALLSVLYAFNVAEAWYSISKIALYISAMWVVYLLLQSGTISMREISIGVSLASALSLLMLLIEWQDIRASGTKLWEQKNLYALHTAFGHKNLYASFQLLCMPGLMYLFFHSGKRLRFLPAVLLVLVFLSIGLIQTKSVLLGMVIALVLILPMATSIWFEKKRKAFFIALFVYLLAFACILLLIQMYPDRFTLLLNNDTIRERMLLWKNTQHMIEEHFPLGVGAGNWQVYFPKYGLGEFMKTNYLISDGYTTFQRPHNDFLWVLSELGIAGIIGYAGIFFYALYKGISHIKQVETNKEKTVALAFLASLFAYLFVAITDFPLERNEHQFMLAILLCMLIGSDRKPATEGNKQNKALLLIPLLLVLLSLGYAMNRLPNEQHAKKIIQAQMTGNWQLILKEAKRIPSATYNLDNFSIPIAWYEGLAHYSLNNHAAAKEKFTEAYNLNPYQVHVLNNMAGMYEQEGNHAEALKFYDALLKISPRQPDAILNKSAVLFNEGKTNEAMECLYQFSYDEKNDQFLQYLQAIGKSYLTMKSEKELPDIKIAHQNKLNDPECIKTFFRFNKTQNHTFDQISWPDEHP